MPLSGKAPILSVSTEIENPPLSISDLFTRLFKLRQDKGSDRQPTFKTGLEALATALENEPHPYDLSNAQLKALMKTNAFRYGAAGKEAELTDYQYLYRISTIRKVQSYTTQSDWKSTTPRRDDQPWVAFQYWENEFSRSRRWLRLSDYADGVFASPRGFSFWTNQELPSGDVEKLLTDVHALGIPNDWLDEYCLLMRLDIRSLDDSDLARIPTVLDAFDSYIFHATKESENPTCGMAIKLDLNHPLGIGHSEFAVRPVATTKIEILPVYIPEDASPYVNSRDELLLNSLNSYYGSL